MKLPEKTKRIIGLSADAFRFTLQWGFVPFVVYLGFHHGAEPGPNGEITRKIRSDMPADRSRKAGLKSILTAYHLVNALFSIAFVASKLLPPICRSLYSGEMACSFDTREHEVLVFLCVVVVWKNRKRAANWLQYLSTFFLFAKLGNLFLFYRANPLYGLVYGLGAVAAYILLPEPEFAESDKITFFHSAALQRELARDLAVVWVIEFFASWSRDSQQLAPVFSSLSDKYTLPNLRFGKLDVGKYPKEAEHFRINNHPMSKQLPSIAIFKRGEQVDRRPTVKNNKAVPFVFTEVRTENCILAFQLNDLYIDCKSKAKRKELPSQDDSEKPHQE